MPEVAVRAPGTPIWVDLASPDLEASSAFYEKLFGWKAHVGPEPQAAGYFTLRGKHVAGLGPLRNPSESPAWSIYIGTDNADASAKAVREAGGRVIAEPFDVLKAGRMAVFRDPTGASISVWQPGEHKGAELVNEPNSFCWSELWTRELEPAKAFYKRVFGWGSETSTSTIPYTDWKLGGENVGGSMPMAHQSRANMPTRWLTYFAVADCDASATKACELGAKVVVPPTDPDFPGGRFAVLTDPQGAAFGILRMTG